MGSFPKVVLVFLLPISAFSADIEEKIQSLFQQISASDTASSVHAIAVLPFNSSVPDEGTMVAEKAVVFFSSQPKYKVIERAEFLRVAQELALSQSGMIEEQKAIEAGKMLAAEVMLAGSVTAAFGGKTITARLIDTRTGVLIASASVTVEAAVMTSFVKEAMGEQGGPSGAIFRSLLVPGWGQYFVHKPVAGTIYLSLAALSVSGLVYTGVDFAGKDADYSDLLSGGIGMSATQYAQALKDAGTKRSDAATIFAMAGGITGGVWVINIIDAAIRGSANAKRVRHLYFSCSPRSGGTVESRIVIGLK
ncbi:MAG: CsgG/HfaB family protein [Chitinispirillaceae bacterium]|nr:CsgG/HfaB family protein [Chitinispirillaceae bacterium]